MTQVFNFISIGTILSKVTSELIITIRPNWNHKFLRSYFCEKFGLPSTTRISEKEFISVLYCLLFIRIDVDNPTLRLQIENLLRSCTLPKGFQEIVKFLPLGGTIYQFKSHQVRFVLSDEFVEFIRNGLKNQSLTMDVSEMSRHLNSNSHSIKETFNSTFLLSQGKGFVINSYFSSKDLNVSLNGPDFVLNLCTKSPEINCGLALSIIFGFTCESNSDTDKFFGIVAEAGLSDSDLNISARTSFDYLLRDYKKSSSASGNTTVMNNPINESKRDIVQDFNSSQSLLSDNIVRTFKSKTKLLENASSNLETSKIEALNLLCLKAFSSLMKIYENEFKKLKVSGVHS